MKKFLTMLLSLIMVFACFNYLIACNNTSEETTEVKRMTVDINPSVEFMLDAENKVVSVTGLNDDGDLLVSGEVFIGKTAEEASELVVELATDAGFLVKGSATQNKVSVSISGAEKEVENLYNKIENKINAFLNSNGVAATLNKIDAVKIDVLKQMVAKCYPELAEEEINAKTEEELLKLLKQSRVECANLHTQALRDSYYKMKEYEFDLASYEKTAEIIAGLEGEYQQLLTVYNSALQNFKDAIIAIETAQYNYFIDPESDYQKALASLQDKKAEILEISKQIAEASEVEKVGLEIQLSALQFEYDTMSTTLTTVKNLADTTIKALVDSLKSFETMLIELKNEFPEEVTEILNGKVNDISSAMNNAKNGAIEKFENKYKGDIEKHNEDMKKRKEGVYGKKQPA